MLPSVTLDATSSIGGPGNMVINSAIGDNGVGYSLTKVGTGTVILGGVNTYGGATIVSGGKLVGVVGGSSASSAVEVKPGYAFGVSIPDNTKQWTCTSLTFDDSTTTLEFNFGSVTPSTTLAPLNVTTFVTFSGTPTVTILEAGSLPAGTYPLLTCVNGLFGTVPTLANLPPHVTATLTNDGYTLSLVVSGNTEPLKWAVNGTGFWDIGTSENWKDGTGNPAYYQESASVPPVGDSVILDDTYFNSAHNVTLNTTVSPVAVTVNSANSCTISGTGGIAGETGLNQQGSGTTTLSTVNTYTGPTTISAGGLTIGGAGQLGGGAYSASITNNGAFTYNSTAAQTLSGPISGTGTLAQGNGTLVLSAVNTYSGGTTIAAPATLQIGDGVLYNGSTVAGNFTDNGSLVFANFYPQTFTGTLSGTGSLTVAGAASLTLGGSVSGYSGDVVINVGSLIYNNAASQTLSGVISGAGTLVQAGPGTLTLNATSVNTYSGGTIINAGSTLSVNAIDDSGFNPTAIPATGNVTLGGTGATLQYTGASAATLGNTVTGTGTIDLPAGNLELDLAESGTITKTSGGTLTLSGTADNASLGLILNGGTVILNKASQSTAHALGTTTTVNSGVLQLSGTGGDQIYSGVNVTVNSGGVFDANGLSEGMTSLTLKGNGSGSGPLINNTVTNSTITTTASPGGFVLGSNISFASSGSITLAGVITNLNGTPYGITNAGPGTLTLNSINRFSGGLTINAGATVVLNNYSAAGTNDTITINGNGILACNASDSATTTYTNAIIGGSTSAIKITTATGNTYLGGDLTAFTGTVQCNGGQTVIGVANNAAYPISASATWSIANGATLDLQTPYVTNAASVIVNGAGGSDGCLRLDACTQTGTVLLNATNCTIGNGNASAGTIGGVISDGGNHYGFTKTGTAANQTLVLSAANTYTGPTTIAGGTLALAGVGTVGSGTLTVANGATFDVSGLTSTLTLGAAQMLSGPTVAGTATINAAASAGLTMGSSGLLSFPYYVPNTAAFNVTGGALALAGNPVSVTVKNGGNPLTAGSYLLISAAAGGSVGGTVPNSVTVNGDNIAPGTSAALQITSGQLYLVVTSSQPPNATGIALLPGGNISLTVTGAVGTVWSLRTNNNVAAPLPWPNMTNGIISVSPFTVQDVPSPSIPQRYYYFTNTVSP